MNVSSMLVESVVGGEGVKTSVFAKIFEIKSFYYSDSFNITVTLLGKYLSEMMKSGSF